MLLESPGKTIRLYVADVDHELWKNDDRGFDNGTMTLGFHPHHCNLALHCVHGLVINQSVVKDIDGRWIFNQFYYHSKINGSSEESSFESEGYVQFEPSRRSAIGAGESLYLHASEIHTVFVHGGKSAAWLVYEGLEDPDYMPYCYSSADLTNSSLDGLYQKPYEEDIIRLLKIANLL